MGVTLLSLAANAASATGAGTGQTTLAAAGGNFAADLASLLGLQAGVDPASLAAVSSAAIQPGTAMNAAAPGNAQVGVADLARLLQGNAAPQAADAEGAEATEDGGLAALLAGRQQGVTVAAGKGQTVQKQEAMPLARGEETHDFALSAFQTPAALSAVKRGDKNTVTQEQNTVPKPEDTASADASLWASLFMPQPALMPQAQSALPASAVEVGEQAGVSDGGLGLAFGSTRREGAGEPALTASAFAQSAPGLPAGASLVADAASATANLAAPAAEGGQTLASSDFASLLQATPVATAHVAPAHVAQTGTANFSRPVETAFTHPSWGQSVGEQVVWMAKNDQQSAQLTLNPPQLGPVQVTLTMNGEQVSASFVSPNAEVRQALEDSLPRLREMLSGAGVSLGEANVGSQQQNPNPRESMFSSDNRGAGSGGSVRTEDENAILRADVSHQDAGMVSRPVAGRGLVNLYA